MFGDAIYAQDSLIPQVAVGAMYKAADRRALVLALGAHNSAGVDFYLAATKLILDQSLLVNATLRMTRANQLGLLGFGGPRDNGYRPEFEGSVAYLLNRHVAIGAEYRSKPDNLTFAHERDWYDAFVAVFFNDTVSGTLAFVSLGSIAASSRMASISPSRSGFEQCERSVRGFCSGRSCCPGWSRRRSPAPWPPAHCMTISAANPVCRRS